MQRKRFHLAVIGAGHSGAATALFAAEAGLKVAMVERRAIADAGARWVNEVPAWMFERAGLRDLPGNLACSDHVARLFPAGATGGNGVAVKADRVAAIDMRALGEQLVARALQKGVTLRDRAGTVTVEHDQVHCHDETITADFIVDASGLAGINLLGRATARREDLCVAAQDMRVVNDLDQARAYFARFGASGDDALVRLCVEGGYSVLNLRLFGDQIFVLSGSIPALGFVSGRRVVEEFVATQPWIGEALYGGDRAIPLAPPLAPFVRGRYAQVGDAARQVFAAHGSGTGSGLIAARLLVDSLVETQGLERYASRWFREFGATHIVYDLLRRASMALVPGDAARLLELGLINADSLAAGMAQRIPRFNPRTAFTQWRASQRAPELLAKMTSFLRHAPALSALASSYPEDARAQRLWHAAIERLYRPIVALTETSATRASKTQHARQIDVELTAT